MASLSAPLCSDVARIAFIHWLLAHWPNVLPDRKALFDWLGANSSPYRDECVSRLIRIEQLNLSSENQPAAEDDPTEAGRDALSEVSDDTLSRLDQIGAYFEDLKQYLRKYEIKAAVAKKLLERLNLILIAQNRIQDHLRRFV